jgi:hypothetical protein
MKMKLIYNLVLILMAASLLSACGAANSAVATLPASPDPMPTLELQSPTAQSTHPASAPEPTPLPVDAGTNPDQPDANVVHVRAVLAEDGSWVFHVTVEHPDTGWDNYANGWDVVTPEGAVLKATPGDPFTRLLLHPHENEQPFTRSQSGIFIPVGTTQVSVRAHDIVNGFGGQEVTIDLEEDSGPGYEVVK